MHLLTEILYAAPDPGGVVIPCLDPVLTIKAGVAFMSGAKVWTVLTTPWKLTDMIRSHPAEFEALVVPPTPALA